MKEKHTAMDFLEKSKEKSIKFVLKKGDKNFSTTIEIGLKIFFTLFYKNPIKSFYNKFF